MSPTIARPALGTESDYDASVVKWRTPRLWLPLGAIALGSVGVWLAFDLSRASDRPFYELFWAAYLTGFLSIVLAGTARRASRPELLGLTVLLGVYSFMPKLLRSPGGPVYHDEYGHLRHVNDMVATLHVFPSDTFLPIMKYYPGLGILTTVVHTVTRLSTWLSGQLVVGGAHVLLLLILFRLFRLLLKRDSLAFLGVCLFACNPGFIFFDTQFAYESVGMALTFGVILCAVQVRLATQRADVLRGALPALALVPAVTVTHHISTLVAALVCTLVALLVPPHGETAGATRSSRRYGWGIALSTWLSLVLWVGLVAPSTVDYVAPHLRASVSQTLNRFGVHAVTSTSSAGVAVGAERARHVPFSGSVAPLWEKGLGFTAQLVALLLVIVGIRLVWRARGMVRERSGMAPWVILALAYFAAMPLALTAGGGETAHRIWSFSYAGVAVVSAPAVDLLRSRAVGADARRQLSSVVAGLVSAVLVIGNTSAGQNVFYRFPGRLTFGVDGRIGSPDLDRLMAWMRSSLPAGAGVVSDRFTSQEIEAYTACNTVSPTDGPAYGIFRKPMSPDDRVRDVLKKAELSYFVLDKRIFGTLPTQALFSGYHGPADVDRAGLAAAEAGRAPMLEKIFENGTYSVYRVRA